MVLTLAAIGFGPVAAVAPASASSLNLCTLSGHRVDEGAGEGFYGYGLSGSGSCLPSRAPIAVYGPFGGGNVTPLIDLCSLGLPSFIGSGLQLGGTDDIEMTMTVGSRTASTIWTLQSISYAVSSIVDVYQITGGVTGTAIVLGIPCVDAGLASTSTPVTMLLLINA